MNSKTRQRVMRSFLASLLQSELDEAELRDLAEDLTHGSIAMELGELIREAMFNISNVGHSKKDTLHTAPEEFLAYELVTQRKLSKKFVHEIMTLASPWMRSQKPSGTTRELLEKFFNNASESDRRKFMTLLQGETVDPYLKGISRRS